MIALNVDMQTVYKFLMDVNYYPMWQAGLVKVEASDGMNPGSIIKFESVGLGRTFNLSAIILSNDGKSCYEAESKQGPITFESKYKLEPTEFGCTLELRNKIKTSGIFAIAQPALQAISENRYKADLETLKIMLESQGSKKSETKSLSS